MAQTEQMLRLIKDGKIVGREWKLTVKSAKKVLGEDCSNKNFPDLSDNIIITIHIHDKISLWGFGAFHLSYDSFELGIKVGDEWWFKGDRVRRTRLSNIPDTDGELKHDGYRWVIIPDLPGDMPYYIFEATDLKGWKRIGNIHEHAKP